MGDFNGRRKGKRSDLHGSASATGSGVAVVWCDHLWRASVGASQRTSPLSISFFPPAQSCGGRHTTLTPRTGRWNDRRIRSSNSSLLFDDQHGAKTRGVIAVWRRLLAESDDCLLAGEQKCYSSPLRRHLHSRKPSTSCDRARRTPSPLFLCVWLVMRPHARACRRTAPPSAPNACRARRSREEFDGGNVKN